MFKTFKHLLTLFYFEFELLLQKSCKVVASFLLQICKKKDTSLHVGI